MRFPRMTSGALRCAAAMVGMAAIAIVLQQEQRPRQGTPVEQPATPRSASPTSGNPRLWSVRTGGWYIRVDGATVDIPPLEAQLASRPRASLGTTISPYDRLILHHAQAEGFDWRLVAALIFEESRFDPASRSEKGAVGLMQVRPVAAEAVGATRFQAPADNVQAGTRYLRQLDDMFRPAQGIDRLSLVLAAYNMGPGHVHDAQTLARRFGYDPNRWEDAMEIMLPLLEQPAINEHLPNGFANGTATVSYVQRTLDRYRRYRLTAGVLPAEGDASSPAAGPPSNG